jgi:hypothetical protein
MWVRRSNGGSVIVAPVASEPRTRGFIPDFLFEVQAFAFMMTETPVFMRL